LNHKNFQWARGLIVFCLAIKGYFGHFLGFGGILIIFWFLRYFGHFLGFKVIIVIF